MYQANIDLPNSLMCIETKYSKKKIKVLVSSKIKQSLSRRRAAKDTHMMVKLIALPSNFKTKYPLRHTLNILPPLIYTP